MKPYFQEDGITIYHGDCREVMPSLETCDLLLTDPPYGLNFDSNHESTWSAIAGDDSTILRDWLFENLPCGNAYVFGTWKLPRPSQCRQVLIWDKGANSGMGDLSFPWKNSFEEIYVIGNDFSGSRDEAILRGHRVYTWESGPAHDGNGRLHPTEKPLSLVTYLLSRSNARLVLDPFMGSGTTLRAAKDSGRRAIGIEIEEKYCEIAAKRLAQKVLAF